MFSGNWNGGHKHFLFASSFPGCSGAWHSLWAPRRMRLQNASLAPHRTLKTAAKIPKSYDPQWLKMTYSTDLYHTRKLHSHGLLSTVWKMPSIAKSCNVSGEKNVQEMSLVESVCRAMEFKLLIFHFLIWVQQVELSGNKR